MPFDEGLKFINSLDGVEALWIFKNGDIKYSDNFKKYIKE
jgi:thiamine biosynthesis lipoprotein